VSYLRSRARGAGVGALGDTVSCPSGSTGCETGCPPGKTCDYTSADLTKYQPSGGKCWDLKTGAQVPSSLTTCYAKPQTSGPSVWDRITGGAGGALDWFTKYKQNQGALTAYRAGSTQAPSGGLPGWVMPVGIAALGVGAILILTKKRKAPASAAAGGGG
jgi:hypothetical protein